MKYRIKYLWLCLFCFFAAAPASAQESRMSAHPAVAQNMLVKPDMTDEEILDWAAQAAVASMTFGHLDYQPRMKNAAGYFTEAGWKKFAQGLVSVQFLDIMVAQKITLITTPAGKGSIIQQGPVEGAYAWHVILPVAIYHSTEDGDEKRQLMNLSLLITRSNQNKDGRGIADWAQIAAE